MIPLLLDYQWPTVGTTESSGSLLTMPAGGGTVIDHLLSCIGHDADSPYMILPVFESSDAYRKTIGEVSSSAATVVTSDTLQQGLPDHEASDQLVVVDPACWPIREWSLSAHLDPADEYSGATHFVALGTDIDRTMERVVCDDNGRVKRVERVYRRMNWPDIVSNVFVSVVPSRAIGKTRFHSASDLRQQLCARGVLSRDIGLPIDVIRLVEAAGMLALNERLTIYELRGRRGRHGNEERSNDTDVLSNSPLIGPGCDIHSSVRFVGPVVVQDCVTLERGVSIIGPAVLGAGTHVSKDTVIAQSVLGQRSRAASCMTILHRVLIGELTAETVNENGPGFVDAVPVYEPFAVVLNPSESADVDVSVVRRPAKNES